jgi:hypothetical protein
MQELELAENVQKKGGKKRMLSDVRTPGMFIDT